MRRGIIGAAIVLGLVACGGDDDVHPGADIPIVDDGRSTPKIQRQDVERALSERDAAMPEDTAAAGSKDEPAPGKSDAAATTPAKSMDQSTSSMGQPAPMDQSASMPQGNPMPQAGPQPQPLALDECDLDSGWEGDEYCILPPPEDQGFQLHIGPNDYKNPAAEYILQPGQESVHTFTATSANDHDIYFYFRQYRMRPGAHHTIVRDKSTGRRLSGSDVNQDHPVGHIIAPENEGIGIPLAAHSPISVDHHAINTTDKPLLQEVWVNFWYVDPADVKETTTLLYDPGDIGMSVGPRADVVLGPYECDIEQPGRLINMFGHVHANNVRFTAWRTRNGKRDLIYEGFHWEEPLWLEFTSLAKNSPPQPDMLVDGGWTGILDLQPGDTLAWECHEVNQQDTTLRFTNQTFTGTMCIIIGELVGTKCKTRSPFTFNPNFE